jgi:hypothetical protein
MMSVVFHMIQVKDNILQATMLMTMMQFEEHILLLLEVHFNHMHMNFQIGKLEIEITILILLRHTLYKNPSSATVIITKISTSGLAHKVTSRKDFKNITKHTLVAFNPIKP